MHNRNSLNVFTLFFIASLFSEHTWGQTVATFPVRPIHIIVSAAPGGNNDLVARAVGTQAAVGLGQAIVIDNKPGASALVGTQFVAKSKPDGYTLLHISNTFATVPAFILNPGYDPLKDFSAITLTAISPQIMVVRTSLPVITVKELIAFAKNRSPACLLYTSDAADE